ncbi:MAG: hypothetical protein ACJ75B_08375 [Flavisolibacter sp.]
MAAIKSIIAGRWNGYYEHDNSYDVSVRKVTFKMVLEDSGENTFKGKCIDMEAELKNGGISRIEGFLENSFISFTKEYELFKLDENGKQIKAPPTSKFVLTYIGHFDWLTQTFEGTWEILTDNEQDKGGNMIIVGAGKWKMSKA